MLVCALLSFLIALAAAVFGFGGSMVVYAQWRNSSSMAR